MLIHTPVKLNAECRLATMRASGIYMLGDLIASVLFRPLLSLAQVYLLNIIHGYDLLGKHTLRVPLGTLWRLRAFTACSRLSYCRSAPISHVPHRRSRASLFVESSHIF